MVVERERNAQGRAQNARPRDALGRPLPRGSEGVERVPEDLVLEPLPALAEAQRLLEQLGAETRLFDPHELPMLDSVPATHPKVQELRQASLWSEGHVWVSPERHGALTAVFKNQIDWLPLEEGSVRPTQGRTLAVMQVCGGSQSFNVVNALRVLGRWMRMVTIPNQSSVAKAWQEFDDEGRMKPSAYYDRVVDVMEELVKFTLLVRGRTDYLVDRYSERKGAIEAAALAAHARLRGVEDVGHLGQVEAAAHGLAHGAQLLEVHGVSRKLVNEKGRPAAALSCAGLRNLAAPSP